MAATEPEALTVFCVYAFASIDMLMALPLPRLVVFLACTVALLLRLLLLLL